MQQLIQMLANAAIGGLTKGELEAERANQLEAARALQEETKLIAKSQKKKLNTYGAVCGENLVTALLSVNVKNVSPTSRPRKRTGPYFPKRKVTFTTCQNKNSKSSPIISCSATSSHSYSDLDEFSALENEDETSSIASSIFLGTPGPSQSITHSRPPSPTPTTPGKKTDATPSSQGILRRSKRIHGS